MGQGEEYDGALGRCYVLVGTIDRPAARKRGARRGSRSGPRDHNHQPRRLSVSDPSAWLRKTLPTRQLLITLNSRLRWCTSLCVSLAQRIRQNHRRNFRVYFSNTSIRASNISGFCSEFILRIGEQRRQRQRLRLRLMQNSRSINPSTSDPYHIHQKIPHIRKRARQSLNLPDPDTEIGASYCISVSITIQVGDNTGGNTIEYATLHQVLCPMRGDLRLFP